MFSSFICPLPDRTFSLVFVPIIISFFSSFSQHTHTPSAHAHACANTHTRRGFGHVILQRVWCCCVVFCMCVHMCTMLLCCIIQYCVFARIHTPWIWSSFFLSFCCNVYSAIWLYYTIIVYVCTDKAIKKKKKKKKKAPLRCFPSSHLVVCLLCVLSPDVILCG